MDFPPLRDRADSVVRFAFGVFIAVGCFMVAWPFATAISVAAVIAVVSWPLFKRIRTSCGGSDFIASLIMVTLLTVLIVIPIIGLSLVSAQQIPGLIETIRHWIDSGLNLPAEIHSIPLVGDWLYNELQTLIDSESDLITLAQNVFDPISKGLLKGAVALGDSVVQLVLMLFVVFFFYRDGDYISDRCLALLRRMSGNLALEVRTIIVSTTRSVVYGIVGSAACQAIVALIGFAICGIPHAVVLSIAVFVFAPVPIGPPLIWGPAAVWLFYQGEVGFGIFLVLWGLLAVAGVDNFLKPVLISKQGAPLSMALIYLGVFGGIIAFGFMGIILGPVVLAVGVDMCKVWLSFSSDNQTDENQLELASDSEKDKEVPSNIAD